MENNRFENRKMKKKYIKIGVIKTINLRLFWFLKSNDEEEEESII